MQNGLRETSNSAPCPSLVHIRMKTVVGMDTASNTYKNTAWFHSHNIRITARGVKWRRPCVTDWRILCTWYAEIVFDGPAPWVLDGGTWAIELKNNKAFYHIARHFPGPRRMAQLGERWFVPTGSWVSLLVWVELDFFVVNSSLATLAGGSRR